MLSVKFQRTDETGDEFISTILVLNILCLERYIDYEQEEIYAEQVQLQDWLTVDLPRDTFSPSEL